MRKFYSLLICVLLISAIGVFQAPIPVLAANGTLSFTPSYVSFGNVTVGTRSNPVNVTIKNTGTVNVTLGRMSISGDYKIRTNDCTNGKILIPTHTCVFSVIFTPISIAYKSGSVSIPSDAVNPLYTVSLTGYGIGTNLLLFPNFDPPLIKPFPWMDGHKVLSTTDMDCSVWFSPMCSVRLNGGSDNTTRTISQAVARIGAPGDRFAFLITSKALDIPAAGLYSVEVVFWNAYNQVVGSRTLNFKTGTHDWQTVVGMIRAPANYAWVVFRFKLQKTSGTAWFDNAILVKIP